MDIEKNMELQKFMEFLGYELVEVDYFGWEDETQWQKENDAWMDKMGINSVGHYFVIVEADKWEKVGYFDPLKSKKANSWIMEAIEKMNLLNFPVYIFPDAIMIKENNTISSSSIVNVKYKRAEMLSGIHKAVMQFIALYNEKQKKMIKS